MLKKILTIAAVLVVATAGAAGAQAYGDEDTTTVSDSTVEQGEPITISSGVFLPGSSVDFTLFSAPIHLGTAVADAEGIATLTATIPEGVAPGSHTVEASGIGVDGQPLTVSTAITVLGEGTGAGSTDVLARTGGDSISLMQVGIAAVVFGGLLVLVANKRRRRATDRDTVGV